MNKTQIAVEKFKQGYNCSQSVLYSYADDLHISKDTALRIANGFGAGMGRKQEVCGAVSGAIMVLGLMYGRGENEDKTKHEQTYAKVRELIDAFSKEYGTINCKQLLSGCILLTPEGQRQFHENGMIDKCAEYVERVSRLLERMTDMTNY